MSNRWTPEDEQSLRFMMKKGDFFHEIAEYLGRTKSAVEKKAERMGLFSINKFLRDKPAAVMVIEYCGNLRFIATNNVDRKLSEFAMAKSRLITIWYFDTGQEAYDLKRYLTDMEIQ